MSVDISGGWHPSALATIKKLGCQLARNVGREDTEVARHLRQRISILLERDNVVMQIVGTLLSFPPLLLSDGLLPPMASSPYPLPKLAYPGNGAEGQGSHKVK